MIPKTSEPYFLPDLFYGVHFRRIWRNEEQANIVWYIQFCRLMPCGTVATQKNRIIRISLLVCDGAAWHKSGTLEVPEGISILHIPPYTPEMNPIEQIWRELRTRGFRNEVFSTLEKVVDRLCKTINHLSRYTVMSIAQRKWIKDIFN